jgi:hypothetical protein
MMLRGQDLQDTPVDQTTLPNTDRTARRPFAHIVVTRLRNDRRRVADAARCPSGASLSSGTAPRPGTGSRSRGRERPSASGSTISLASLINYRTPVEVMSEAEPVIRAMPDANVPIIRSSGVPVHGSGRIQARSPTPGSPSMPTGSLAPSAPVRSKAACSGDVASITHPGAVEGSVRPGRRHRPGGAFGEDIEGAVDRVAMTRATQRFVILTNT